MLAFQGSLFQDNNFRYFTELLQRTRVEDAGDCTDLYTSRRPSVACSIWLHAPAAGVIMS
jgi:hypothetical protein